MASVTKGKGRSLCVSPSLFPGPGTHRLTFAGTPYSMNGGSGRTETRIIPVRQRYEGSMGSRAIYIFAWCALAVLIPQGGRAQDVASAGVSAARTYRFTGVVTDPSREPIAGAELVVLTPASAGRSTATDDRGRFNLGEFTAGLLSFRVRRLGYEARTMDVQIGTGGQHTSVEIALTIVPAELANVFVTGAPGRLNEFFQRRQQRAAFGRFMDQEEIRK
jgi:hypothetical protein